MEYKILHYTKRNCDCVLVAEEKQMKYLFVFKSRTSAFSFITALRKAGIAAEIVSTPASKGGGCGLSVKVSDLSKAKKVKK